MAPLSPPARSVIGTGTRNGGPSAGPLMLMSPDMPDAMRSNPAREEYGPVWPNPEMEQ